MATQHTQGKWKSRTNATSLGGDRYANRLEIYAPPANDSKNHINIICTLEDIHYSQPYSQSIVNQEVNAALICDAVNNTAGKGIDPKAVPELLQTLTALLYEAGTIHKNRPDDYNPVAYGKLAEYILKGEQAIKAAELK